ncbi:group II intron reverse transcriptase domain-containing protein [Candidatus Uhrbacteria bacterium]|nr:group II intron reverse transcriptase domain-containing protein [Candidatus Uhrbacteria bacterium]
MSIDLSLENIWNSWFLFKRGKQVNAEFEDFIYFLEPNLYTLYQDLNNGGYRHGGYKTFIVEDPKKREISVAGIRDRVVHRLLYEYLAVIYDRTFIFDVWSCRKGKGLTGAIERAQSFLKSSPRSFVWRADVKKFFDNVDHEVLKKTLRYKILNPNALAILDEVINSYSVAAFQAGPKGIPIGNLTSQIFANIYLNELDRFVKHHLKIKAYLRYGDDFILVADNYELAAKFRLAVTSFLNRELGLEVNHKNDVILKPKQGLSFLGVEMFSTSRKLNEGTQSRIKNRLSLKNIPSYAGLVAANSNMATIREFNWSILEQLEDYEKST